MPGWHKESGAKSSEFVSTPQNERLIAEMIQSHFVGDFCVVGEKVHYTTQPRDYMHTPHSLWMHRVLVRLS